MKSFTFISLAALALVTGCAASSEDVTGGTSDEVNAQKNVIELAETTDDASLQAKLFTLMQTLGSEAGVTVENGHSGVAAMLTAKLPGGAEEDGVKRSISCAKTMVRLAGGPATTTTRTAYRCSFEGFAQNRGGGTLPTTTILNPEPNQDFPLANKIFSLLHEGMEKGDLGVERIGGNQNPGCCDIPSTDILAIKDPSGGELKCTNATGGFAFMVQTSCQYTRAIQPNE